MYLTDSNSNIFYCIKLKYKQLNFLVNLQFQMFEIPYGRLYYGFLQFNTKQCLLKLLLLDIFCYKPIMLFILANTFLILLKIPNNSVTYTVLTISNNSLLLHCARVFESAS